MSPVPMMRMCQTALTLLFAIGTLAQTRTAGAAADPAKTSEKSATAASPGDAVDLSGEELGSVDERDARSDADSWHRRVSLTGFLAAGYLDSGSAGARPNGGFLVKQGALYLKAEPWRDIFVYTEVELPGLAADGENKLQTSELYLQWRNIVGHEGEDCLNLKVGRFDLPFGEEYTWRHAPDNPLITPSAPFFYGTDEGLLLYGRLGGLNWVGSITDGTLDRSTDNNHAKALNLKLFGTVRDVWTFSGSAMRTGAVEESAIAFGGSYFEPVGFPEEGLPSTAGSSPSETVDATLFEVDGRYDFGKGGAHGHVLAAFGAARQDDDAHAFDRRLNWWIVEPLWRITPHFYAVLRYSAIGTTDRREGFLFEGEITAHGDAFGFDTHRLTRISAGVGWRPNPVTTLKAEVGRDHFDLIEGSPFDAQNDRRNFFGAELVVAF